MIQFKCPHCSKDLSAPDDRIGTEAACPGCHNRLVISQQATAVSTAPPPKKSPSHVWQICLWITGGTVALWLVALAATSFSAVQEAAASAMASFVVVAAYVVARCLSEISQDH